MLGFCCKLLRSVTDDTICRPACLGGDTFIMHSRPAPLSSPGGVRPA